MTFTEFKRTVMAEFAISYPDQEPVGSPIGASQADLIWDRLQSLLLSGRFIYSTGTEVTLLDGASSVDLAAEDPPIGHVESVKNGTTPLRHADGSVIVRLDPEAEGLIEYWHQPAMGSISFWRIPEANTDLLLECFTGLAVALKTTGELPIPEDSLLLLASCVCHRMARRPDPNMKAMAEKGCGIAAARAASHRLRSRLK